MKSLSVRVESITHLRISALAARRGIPTEVAAAVILDAYAKHIDIFSLPELPSNVVNVPQKKLL